MFQQARKLHYIAVLAAQIFLLFVAAVMEHHLSLTILFIVALFGIFGSIISTVWGSSFTRTLGLAIAAIAIVSGFGTLVPGTSEYVDRVGLTVCCFSYAAFILIAIVSIGKHVFVTDRITANRIIGSICIYMLIGMFYAFIYAGIGLISGTAFQMSNFEGTHPMFHLRDFIYMSFTTLTTTGYGDMVPTHAVPRMVTVLEEVSGSIYLVIMVARLVGMHIAQSHPHHQSEHQHER